MPGKAYYGCKKVVSIIGILVTMLAVVAFFAYVYLLPTISPEIFTNPKRIVEAPERQRIYEVTDEFIDTYAYVEMKSEIDWIGSKEWVSSTLETLKADRDSFNRLDPLRTEGTIVKAYDNLVDMEIRLLREYMRMYEYEMPEDVDDVGIGDCEIQWNQLLLYYDEFKAADAEYQAQLAEQEAEKEAEKETGQDAGSGEGQEA